MSKRCLVLGSARCLWPDIHGAMALGEYDAVYAAKHAGIVWDGVLDVWCSLHPEMIDSMLDQRRSFGRPDPRQMVCHVPHPRANRIEPRYFVGAQKISGSSGMMAVYCAMEDGFDRIVLCGMPMERSEGRIDGRLRWESAVTYQKRNLPAIPAMQGIVKSMSGWTRQQLGAPTIEWLSGHDPARDARSSGMDDTCQSL